MMKTATKTSLERFRSSIRIETGRSYRLKLSKTALQQTCLRVVLIEKMNICQVVFSIRAFTQSETPAHRASALSDQTDLLP